MMDSKIELEVPLGKVSLYMNPHFCKMEHFAKPHDSLEEAKESVKMVAELLSAHHISSIPFLADIRAIKKASKEVRDFLAKQGLTAYQAKNAILVNSGLSKIVGNIYLRFSKPITPSKLFVNENKAIDWLLA